MSARKTLGCVACVVIWGQHLGAIVWAPVLDQDGLVQLQLRNMQTENQPFLDPNSNIGTGIVQSGGKELIRFEDCYTATRTGPDYGGMYTDPQYNNSSIRDIMQSSIVEAAQRGVTNLEIIVYTTTPMELHYSATCTRSGNTLPMNVVEEDASCAQYSTPRVPRAYTLSGNEWLDQLSAYNSSTAGNASPMGLRIRIVATAGVIAMVRDLYNISDPSRIPASLAYPASIPLGIDESGNTINNMLDISNKDVLILLGNYVEDIITYAEVRSGTQVQSVALSLDGGRESSLHWMDAQKNEYWASFPSIGAYNNCSNFKQRVDFFKKRAECLRDVYRAFAQSVKSVRSDIRAEVFYQAWVIDDDYRGTFDLYETLRGTGIDGLSHDVWPKWPFGRDKGQTVSIETNLKWAATSNSIMKMLNRSTSGVDMEIVSEFSWAHYDVQNGEDNAWDAGHLARENAVGFDNQARAASMYGWAGMTYCNWTMHEMLEPPYIAGDNSYNAAWEKVIGPPAANANHIGTWQAVSELPSANKAIFLSTVGKMYGRVQEAGDIYPELYPRWFDDFGVNVTNRKVDVITDAMIADNGAIFDQYDKVFMPYETSRYFSAWVRNYLVSLSDVVADKIQVQDQKGKQYNGSNYAYVKDWLADPSTHDVYDEDFPRSSDYPNFVTRLDKSHRNSAPNLRF